MISTSRVADDESAKEQELRDKALSSMKTSPPSSDKAAQDDMDVD